MAITITKKGSPDAKLVEAKKLLRSIVVEIDEFYRGPFTDPETSETEEQFGSFRAMGDDDKGNVDISWPNLKCLGDDIRKFLEE